MRIDRSIDLYVKSKSQGNRPRTIESYRRLFRFLNDYLQTHFPNVQTLEDLEPDQIMDYLLDYRSRCPRGRSVLMSIILFRGWFKFLMDLDALDDKGWLKLIKPIRVDEQERTALGNAEVERLVETAEDGKNPFTTARDTAMLKLMLDSGLRATEVVSLQVADLDIDNRSVSIRAGVSKSRVSRIVDFGLDSYKAIRRYARLRAERVRQRKLADSDQSPLFLSHRDEGLSYSALYRVVRKYAREAGIDNLHPHALRHTNATMLLDNGMDLPYVQRHLGHKHISTTQIYLHVSREKAREVFDRTSPLDNIRRH